MRQMEVVHMRQMRAAGIDAFGDAVRMLDLSAPSSPAPDEVVISVRAAGVGNCVIGESPKPGRSRRKSR